MGLWKWLKDTYEKDCREQRERIRRKEHGTLMRWIAQIKTGRCFQCGGRIVYGHDGIEDVVCCEHQYTRRDIGLMGDNRCLNVASYAKLIGMAYNFKEELPSLVDHLTEFTRPTDHR